VGGGGRGGGGFFYFFFYFFFSLFFDRRFTDLSPVGKGAGAGLRCNLVTGIVQAHAEKYFGYNNPSKLAAAVFRGVEASPQYSQFCPRHKSTVACRRSAAPVCHVKILSAKEREVAGLGQLEICGGRMHRSSW